MEITELGNRVADIQSVTGIRHSGSFILITFEPAGANPTIVIGIYGVNVRAVGNIDNNISNRFAFICGLVSTKTDLESICVNSCTGEGAFAINKTDFTALNISFIIQGHAIHVDPAIAGNNCLDCAFAGNIEFTVVDQLGSRQCGISHVDRTIGFDCQNRVDRICIAFAKIDFRTGNVENTGIACFVKGSANLNRSTAM